MDRPTIAIDAQTTTGQKSGLGFYTENLIRELPNIAPEFNYRFMTARRSGDLNVPRRFFWDQIGFPIKSWRFDLLHQPGFSTPILRGRSKVVVTSHDLVSLIYRDLPFWPNLYFGKWMPFTHHFADHIIADSESTKRDLIRFLKIPATKITVVYLAADLEFRPLLNSKSRLAAMRKYHIPGSYLIHIGNLVPRKNINFLIRAFGQIAKKHSQISLVIAGGKNSYHETITGQAEKLGLAKRVILTGYVAQEDLPILLAGAEIAPFPSLYEGFGLPPLQAMAAGVPVISSNTSSLPEVVGDAGILLDPRDEKAWVHNLDQLLSQSKFRLKLRAKGLIQAQKFSWQKTVRQTAAVYARVLAGQR